MPFGSCLPYVHWRPLIVLTLGLFTLVINALMLLVTGSLSASWNLGFTVSGFWAAFWGGLVVGLVSMLLALVLPGKATRPYDVGKIEK